MQENSTPTGPSPEEIKRRSEQENAEWEADYKARNPQQPTTMQETRPEIFELEAVIALFEFKHSLKALHAIVEISQDLIVAFRYADDLADPRRIENDIKTYEKHNPSYVETYKANMAKRAETILRLKPEDAKKFGMRVAAKKDLAPIAAKLNNLKENENYKKLKAKCAHLFMAVGTPQDNKINHS